MNPNELDWLTPSQKKLFRKIADGKYEQDGTLERDLKELSDNIRAEVRKEQAAELGITPEMLNRLRQELPQPE